MPTFQSDDEAKAWADTWVAVHSPTDVAASLAASELDHRMQFSDAYGRFAAQYDVGVAALATLVEELNFVRRDGWPEHRAIQYVLVAYNLRHFDTAIDLVVRGRYEEAISLTRGLYETFVRLLFVSCHADSAYSVLASSPPKGVRRFNLTNFLRDELRLDWERKYGVMSAFAHSNVHRAGLALRRAATPAGEPEAFGLGLGFDAALAEAALPFMQFVLLAHLRFAVERLVSGSAPSSDPLVVAQEAVDLFTYAHASHPKPYWRMVATDLEYLSKVLEIADRGEDWRPLAAARPVVAVAGLDAV